ncbi:MAG: hypothetical protein KKA70_12460 [Proteobacteria bacterium]|nr:hypothetical protein [Pseudomonadota bacterium]
MQTPLNSRGIYALVLFCIFFLGTPFNSLASSIKIEGRVFTESGPMAAAMVFIYKTFEEIEAETPFMVSEPTDSNGVYQVELPPDNYYFTATGLDNGKIFKAYHGSNPVKVEKENIWLTLMANEVKKPVYSDGPTSVKGLVTYKGEPIKDAYVALYRFGTKQLKGLGFRTESINNDGTFNLSVPAGKFMLVSKKMVDKKRIRPLRGGDLFCYYPENPLEVKFDQTVSVEIPCYPKNDRKSFADVPEIKENNYVTMDNLSSESQFGIRGKITDLEGKPVPNIFVMAHHTHTPVFMMFNISHGSEYVGETDKDGNYFIPVDQAGDYYIIARNTLGGGPHRGDIYGLYGGNAMHVVNLKEKQMVEGIDIAVSSALDEKYLSTLRYLDSPNKLEIKDAALTDYTIAQDTLMSGKIEITGTLLVKRGVTLTIAPGTIVSFTKIDRDNNGIGDGEITVEGRIVARGTKEEKIYFQSAEKIPQNKDWAYLLVLATASDSVFEYCDIQNAFTGMQIHYSNASISDCLFHNNHEGLRFNRTNLVMEHSTFINNDIGFRFARLEGRVFLRNNLITKNDVGALFMRPHVNTVDFNEPQFNLEPPVLLNNNIYDNLGYDYKIGDRQSINVDIRNNWWGSANEQVIADRIYDKHDDEILGEALFEPFLKESVLDVGVR